MPDAMRDARERVYAMRFKANDVPFNQALDALVAARDAEWRAAVEGVRRAHFQYCGTRRNDFCSCGASDHNDALDALLRAMGLTPEGK